MSTTILTEVTPSEMLRVAQAVVRVMRDSEQTSEIHVTEEITGRARFREIRRQLFDTEEGRDLLRDRPELCSSAVDFDVLRALPEGTLGGAYVRHLDENGLSADYQAAVTRYVDEPEMAYLMRRFRQTHDVWHALTELGTQGHEEVIIHAFSWGQLRLPVSAMVVFFGTLKHIIGEARWGALRHALREAYEHGRDAAPLLPVYWERYWEEPLDDVRRRYGVKPCTHALVHG
ncbi:MAG: Coq4 family protein [Polyangiaceae bacterium]